MELSNYSLMALGGFFLVVLPLLGYWLVNLAFLLVSEDRWRQIYSLEMLDALSHTSLHSMFVGPAAVAVFFTEKTSMHRFVGYVVWPVFFFVVGVLISRIANSSEHRDEH